MAVKAPAGPDPASTFGRSVVIDASIASELDEGQIARMRISGVTAVNYTVPHPQADLRRCLREIGETLDVIDAHSDVLTLIRSADDIERAKREHRVGMILGPQNALPCEEDPHCFRVLRELGVLIMQLTYNERNGFGDGVTVADDRGLTPLGRRAVTEMDRVGMTIDLSHCGDRTTRDVIEASAHPVLITHANARALHPSPRNKPDDILRALAARGGVIGLTLWSPMLAYDRHPGLPDFVRQVAYVADLIGIEHVAIGTDHSEGTPRAQWELDFGPNGRYPSVTGNLGPWYRYETRFADGGSSVTDFPAIARAIATLGLSEQELGGVLGANLLRVFRATWGAAPSSG